MSIELASGAIALLTRVFRVPNITRILRTGGVQGSPLVASLLPVGLSSWLVCFIVRDDIVGIVAHIRAVTGGGITAAPTGRGAATLPAPPNPHPCPLATPD